MISKNKYILEIAVFICGAIVMVFEIVGSRVLAPYMGTSIFVWTSLIGIILGSLSLGYYLGGRLADYKTDFKILSLIIFISAILVAILIFVKEPLLILLQTISSNIKTNSIIASLILFAPASFTLGMVSPYAIKLKIKNIKTSGSTVGNLYAISTTGSIVGTFLASFWLIPTYGTNNLLFILAIVLIVTSLSLSLSFRFIKLISLIVLILPLIFNYQKLAAEQVGLIDIDTSYNRIWIFESTYQDENLPARFLSMNGSNSSAMYLESDELVYEYTEYYHLIWHFEPDFQRALMIGGAAYSFPKDFLTQYPYAQIDVVEIDPTVTDIAKKYFELTNESLLSIYHQDGRVYLNTTSAKYNVIFGDAFSSRYSIPHNLTTIEAVQHKYDILTENGVVILNIISAINGPQGQFLRAELATYQSIFPQVYLFPVREPDNPELVQNIILVALKSPQQPEFTSSDPVLNEYLQHLYTSDIANDIPILTDDFAPVDYYIDKAI